MPLVACACPDYPSQLLRHIGAAEATAGKFGMRQDQPTGRVGEVAGHYSSLQGDGLSES